MVGHWPPDLTSVEYSTTSSLATWNLLRKFVKTPILCVCKIWWRIFFTVGEAVRSTCGHSDEEKDRFHLSLHQTITASWILGFPDFEIPWFSIPGFLVPSFWASRIFPLWPSNSFPDFGFPRFWVSQILRFQDFEFPGFSASKTGNWKSGNWKSGNLKIREVGFRDF